MLSQNSRIGMFGLVLVCKHLGWVGTYLARLYTMVPSCCHVWYNVGAPVLCSRARYACLLLMLLEHANLQWVRTEVVPLVLLLASGLTE